MKKLLVVFILLAFVLVGCTTATPVAEVAEVATEVPSNEDAETASEPAQDLIPTALPIDPLNLKFMTSDDVELDGEFWAPTYSDAPVVVLMHQYPMDHNIEWIGIAPWLQNRGLANFVRTGGEPWADPRWFAPMIEGLDFGVFTFTFRNCLGGCKENSVESREEWILDAVAGIESAASFVTIDRTKVIVMGTSIGADAAVDACARLLDSEKATCIGVVSLSPGSYLGEPFDEAVKELTEAGIPVKCVAAADDTLSAETCQSVEVEGYESIITPGDVHGVRLFDPSLDIDLTVLLQGWFIEWAYVNQ